MVRAKLAEPYLHWLGQLVGMTMAIVQERSLSFLLVASQLPQAVGRGARHMQLALGQSFLPRVACEHRLDELQSPLALKMIFHPLRPFLSGSSRIVLGRIVPSRLILV